MRHMTTASVQAVCKYKLMPLFVHVALKNEILLNMHAKCSTSSCSNFFLKKRAPESSKAKGKFTKKAF